uniref:IVa2 protein n=1 Tax=Cardioderma bat adenovirus TaxID=3141913 RepID=A0AAU7E1Z1_9ADEN
MGHLTELWDRMSVLQRTLEKIPYSEGLKPLQNFASVDELAAMGGMQLLQELVEGNKKTRDLMNATAPYLHADGTCSSLNFDTQPFIAVVYGPTGCGKSQLLRNLISSQLIHPAPETIFFITPQVNMIPPQEIAAWKTQICEGNFRAGDQDTIVPQSGSLMPHFVQMAYPELLNEANYDVSHPDNVFAKAASKGPIAIIIDECMEDLGSHKGVSKFFHAFPSKLHDKFPRCTGYSVIVVLHNMNPRKDLGGNIANLKSQAKAHIISPKVHPTQINRFINTFTKGNPPAITLLLKDIFNFYRVNSKYDWVVYNCHPVDDSMQWMYLHPNEGLMPMYLNVQTQVYALMEKISKVINDRKRWTRNYHLKAK